MFKAFKMVLHHSIIFLVGSCSQAIEISFIVTFQATTPIINKAYRPNAHLLDLKFLGRELISVKIIEQFDISDLV